MPDKQENPFARVDDGADAPRRRPLLNNRLLIAIAAVVVVAGVAVGIAIALSGSSAKHSAALRTASSAQVNLPPGVASLPGISPGILGVAALLEPAPGTLTRAQALQAYDRIPEALQRSGRTVKTALARVVYVDGGQLRNATVWIVSVWHHPPYIGGAAQHQWCVTHQLLDAKTGKPFFATDNCLASGGHPVSVHS